MLYRRAGGVIERRIAGETVLVPIARMTGGAAADGEATQFFVLNATGQALWEVLAEPSTLDVMARHLTHNFDVSVEQALVDVVSFVEQLQQHGMIFASERP